MQLDLIFFIEKRKTAFNLIKIKKIVITFCENPGSLVSELIVGFGKINMKTILF